MTNPELFKLVFAGCSLIGIASIVAIRQLVKRSLPGDGIVKEPLSTLEPLYRVYLSYKGMDGQIINQQIGISNEPFNLKFPLDIRPELRYEVRPKFNRDAKGRFAKKEDLK